MRLFIRLTLVFLILLVPSASSQEIHTNLLQSVIELVKDEYIDETNEDEIVESAINGMLQSLDPHSIYLNPKNFSELKNDTRGEFGGLGIEVTMEKGLVKVITPIEDSPADKVGVKAGDYIVKIEDEQVQGKSLMEAVKLMRGKIGTPINITVRRLEVDEDLKFTIIRDVVKVREVSSSILDNVGYLRLRAFNEQSSKQLIKKINNFKKTKKDLNGYILI